MILLIRKLPNLQIKNKKTKINRNSLTRGNSQKNNLQLNFLIFFKSNKSQENRRNFSQVPKKKIIWINTPQIPWKNIFSNKKIKKDNLQKIIWKNQSLYGKVRSEGVREQSVKKSWGWKKVIFWKIIKANLFLAMKW